MSRILFYCFSVLFLIACNKGDNRPVIEEKERTLLIYISGNNSLSGNVDRSLENIKSGVRNADSNSDYVLVYVDKRGNNPRLLLIEKEEGTVVQKVVKEYEAQNSASKEVMSAVLKDAFGAYPSKRQALSLWSHGYGWVPSSFPPSRGNYRGTYSEDSMNPLLRHVVLTRWFGQDGSDFMELAELKEVLKQFPKFEYIVFDACLMGNIEVVYELRDCADYIMASPTEVLAYGFPYQWMLPFMCKPVPDLQRACEQFYEFYNTKQDNQIASASIALVQTSGLEPLASTVAAIMAGNTSLASLNPDNVQAYDPYVNNVFYDLGDFIGQIAPSDAYELFRQRLEQVVLAAYHTPTTLSALVSGWGSTITIQKYSGLSTYIKIPKYSSLNPDPDYDLSAASALLEWNRAIGY